MSAPPASNGVFVVIPPSNASGLRPPPAILPTSMCQPPGIMQFEESQLGAQAPRATQPPDLRPMETFLTGEPKALGTVQILIGLIHLGFGSVLLMVRRGHLGMLFIEGGVPFWGGACFIISGSLSVAAERNHTSCLVSLNGHREPGIGMVPTYLGATRDPAPICSLIWPIQQALLGDFLSVHRRNLNIHIQKEETRHLQNATQGRW